MTSHRPPHRRTLCAAFLIASLALATAGRASITPEARAVVERYLEASGGPEAWQADSAARVRVTLTAMGLEGTHFSWTRRPAASATMTQIGPFTLRDGALGGRAWRVDQNGKLRWLDGRELEDALGGAFFENESWMGPDQGGAAVTLVGEEREGGTRLQVLEVAPPVGRARRFYFDPATGLMVKSTQREDNRTLETRFSGYARISGRLRALDTRTTVSGMPGNDIVAHIESVWVAVRLDSNDFLPAEERKADHRFLGSARSARVPMRYASRHAWVKASVNGAPPEDFLLDTGATATVIDSAFAARYGLQMQGEVEGGGAGGQGKVRFTLLESLRVTGENGQGVEVSDQRVAVLALNRYVAPFFWKDVAGVLGYDFISRFVTTVDFEGQSLTLDEPEGYRFAGSGSEVSVEFSNGIPVVHAQVNGLEGDFRLDVGSGGGVDLHRPFVEKNGLERKVGPTIATQAGGFGGSFTILACRLKSFMLGPYVVREPIGSLSRATTGALASEDFAGNVGNRILERFTCTFDYTHKKLYLQPNKRLDERDEFDRFGAAVTLQEGRYLVAQVIAGSPAAAAGIREGDEVRSMAGRALQGATPDDLLSWVRGIPDGEKLPVELHRGRKTKKVKVKLRSLL